MNRVLVEAFEKICDFAYSNNTSGEGWKTNSDYKVNRRFIHPYICDYDTRWPSDILKIDHQRGETFDDIIMALCA